MLALISQILFITIIFIGFLIALIVFPNSKFVGKATKVVGVELLKGILTLAVVIGIVVFLVVSCENSSSNSYHYDQQRENEIYQERMMYQQCVQEALQKNVDSSGCPD